ncbi:MAG: shikimate kinase [Candidatus Methylacidiphilales bacterium]
METDEGNEPIHIALIGMMGSGKSSAGRELAELADRPFLDLDREIEARQHRTITQIFAEDGEEAFRRMEFDAILRAVCEPPSILSTGGGAVQAEVNRDLLWRSSFVVYLKASVECLWERVRRSRNRPLLQRPDARETLEKLLAEREPRYLEAHYTVDVESASIDDIAANIWDAYCHRHPV